MKIFIQFSKKTNTMVRLLWRVSASVRRGYSTTFVAFNQELRHAGLVSNQTHILKDSPFEKENQSVPKFHAKDMPPVTGLSSLVDTTMNTAIKKE
jgi:hypothetical protein